MEFFFRKEIENLKVQLEDPQEEVVVSPGNVLLGYHGHGCNEPLPGYRHLAIVGHVGRPHISILYT
jgi:hypothetical protein